MCGIVGIAFDSKDRQVEPALLEQMNQKLLQRGPDDEGYYFSAGVGLAMRRLAIIDVAGGKQPMIGPSKKIAAVCNGEIYNFKELREELLKRGHTFYTNADSEVIPHLYEEYGERFAEKMCGMFAVAVWDERRHRLILARDRMGQKPLYWTQTKGQLIFASELKALLVHPEVMPSLDRVSLAKYLAYEYVPAPRSIVANIHKLEAGHFLTLEDGKVRIRQYWNLPTEGESTGISEPLAIEGLKTLFEQSVKRRLISDVPLGVFLSGGIDSSSVVAAMSRFMPAEQIKTFSIGFAEQSFDESSYARQVAKYYGTDHREEICTPESLLNLLPEVVSFLDEPLGDASIIPTYALSKFTRKHVTVALGGDGGDELFAGYPTFLAENYAKQYRRVPSILRKVLLEPAAKLLPVNDDNISLDFKIKQFIKGASHEDFSRHMLWMGSFAPHELNQLLIERSYAEVYDDLYRHMKKARGLSTGNALLYIYAKLYLQDDILTKVDRASMAASLECRAPFLDHDFVEYITRLPYRYKLNGNTMKYLLKKAYENELPKGIAHRAKKGFGIPVAKWIKEPLKEMVQDIFSERKLAAQGLFNPKVIGKLLDDHFAGKVDNRKKLWTLLIFQKWYDRWGVN